jgi:hypothetical protein
MNLNHALQAANRTPPPAATLPVLLMAGATGALGNEVLRCLVGSQRYGTTQVLAREPITPALRGVVAFQVGGDDVALWPTEGASCDVGVVLFDPPRLHHDRERALFTPTPEQLPALARWMHARGVRTLAVVLPHAPGRLPEALKRGLASLDEQAVVALGFERVLLIRSASNIAHSTVATRNALQRLAHWILGAFKYMIPSSEQPVRAAQVAQLVDLALQLAPSGIHVAAPELVWRVAQGGHSRATHNDNLAPPQSTPCPKPNFKLPPWAAAPTRWKPRFTKPCKPPT